MTSKERAWQRELSRIDRENKRAAREIARLRAAKARREAGVAAKPKVLRDPCALCGEREAWIDSYRLNEADQNEAIGLCRACAEEE